MKTAIISSAAAFALSLLTVGVNANTFGFDTDSLTPQNNMVSVALIYDFTEFPMFAGGVDIIYDPASIEFAGFAPGLLPQDVELVSPIGVLTEPGLLENVGFVATDFFNGISSQGTVGTLFFNILGSSDAGATPCGMVICIVSNALNPFVSLLGVDETQSILSNSITSASIAAPVPLPAAFWLMVSGVGLLLRLRS